MMCRVAVIGSLLLFACFSFAQVDATQARSFELPRGTRHTENSALLSGVVRSNDNRAISNARIEVHDMSGIVAASTYSGPNGMFQINGLQEGRYEVVATIGLAEAREQLSLAHGDNNVTLHVNDRSPAADVGRADSVSVAEMRVPDKARKALKKARDLLAKHHDEDAWKEVTRALQIYPQYSDALQQRGIMNYAAGRIDDAIADLNAAIKYDPNNGMAYVAMAAVCNNQEKFDDAMREIERGVSLMPNAWQAYFEMARTQLGKGDFEAALRSTDKAQQFINEDYPLLHLVRAHALLGIKNYAEAQNELEAYLSRDPDGAEAARVRQTLDKVKAFTARAASGK